MVHFYRLITFAICSFFLFSASFNARAELPVRQWSGAINAACSIANYPYTPSLGDAAAAAIQCRNYVFPTPPNPFCSLSSYTDNKVYGNCEGTVYLMGNMPPRNYCASTNTSVATPQTPCPIVCPSGQHDEGGICVGDTCTAGATPVGQPDVYNDFGLPQVVIDGHVTPTSTCISGCVFPTSSCYQGKDDAGTDDVTVCTVGNGSGAQCTVTTSQSGADGVTPCPPGTFTGQVNGTNVCLPSPTGTSSTNTSSTSSTPSGTTETSSTTLCIGDKCTVTTTTTTTPTGGSPTTSETTETKDKSTFCQENQTLQICKEGYFAGSCGTPPSCTGDAVQCATARATFETNCTLNPAANDLSNLGNTLASGVENTTGASLVSAAARETIDLQSSLDTTKFLASGCPADRVIALANGFNLTLPFNSLCSYLQFLGSIVTAFSLLAASRIVGVT